MPSAREAYFDVIVLGAGPSGSATASELARGGLRTALAGRADARPNVGECLPPGIRPQLEKAGVWSEFLRAGHTSSAGIRSIWGSPESVDRDFVLSPYGAGWHIDRSRFDTMLRSSALRNGAVWIECLALKAAKQNSQGWRVTLSTASGNLDAVTSLVIDATGRASAFARRAGAKRRSLDNLAGVAGYYDLPRNDLRRNAVRRNSPPVDALLLVEAVEIGWWYTAPLPGDRMIAVLMTDTDCIQREGLKQRERWTAALRETRQQHRRIEMHGGELQGELRVLPADCSFLDKIVGDRWIAAGDAASAFDPLSSQGIVSAISSGLDAAGAAMAWLNGDQQAPAAYASEARRKYAEYLVHRGLYYGLERRWPESAFWKSRHSPPTSLIARRKEACA